MGRPTKDESLARRRELSEKQIQFVMWAAVPEGAREPRSQAELADVLGVHRITVHRWSRDPRVVEAVRFVVIQNAGDPAKIGSMLDMLHEVALAKKDVRFAELWLKGTGVLAQYSRGASLLDAAAELGVEDFAGLSTEELESLKEANEAGKLEDRAKDAAKVVLASGG